MWLAEFQTQVVLKWILKKKLGLYRRAAADQTSLCEQSANLAAIHSKWIRGMTGGCCSSGDVEGKKFVLEKVEG
jgi:hypothetical protein